MLLNWSLNRVRFNSDIEMRMRGLDASEWILRFKKKKKASPSLWLDRLLITVLLKACTAHACGTKLETVQGSRRTGLLSESWVRKFKGVRKGQGGGGASVLEEGPSERSPSSALLTWPFKPFCGV